MSDAKTPLPQHSLETPKSKNLQVNEIENETDKN